MRAFLPPHFVVLPPPLHLPPSLLPSPLCLLNCPPSSPSPLPYFFLLLLLFSPSDDKFLASVFHIASAEPADHFQAMQRPVQLNYRKNGQQIDPLAVRLYPLAYTSSSCKGNEFNYSQTERRHHKAKTVSFYSLHHPASCIFPVHSRHSENFFGRISELILEKKIKKQVLVFNITRVSQVLLVVKNLPTAQEMQETRVDPWARKIPQRRKWQNPLQYFCWNNSMDRGTWQATIHGAANSWTQLSTHTFNITAQKLSSFPAQYGRWCKCFSGHSVTFILKLMTVLASICFLFFLTKNTIRSNANIYCVYLLSHLLLKVHSSEKEI